MWEPLKSMSVAPYSAKPIPFTVLNDGAAEMGIRSASMDFRMYQHFFLNGLEVLLQTCGEFDAPGCKPLAETQDALR